MIYCDDDELVAFTEPADALRPTWTVTSGAPGSYVSEHPIRNDPCSRNGILLLVDGLLSGRDAKVGSTHRIQMVHRDIKPANILLTDDDFACLVDFGLANAATDAKLTSSGMTIGTFAYMAPERFSNTDVSHRADIYALACVLYECLTGSPPYPTGDLPALINAHLTAPIPRLSQQRREVSAVFDDVIARGMAKKPEHRYGSAGELARAAHRALTVPQQDDANTIEASTQAARQPDIAAAPTRVKPPASPTPKSRPAGKAPAKSRGQSAKPPTSINQQRRALAKRELDQQLARRAAQARVRRGWTIGLSAVLAVTVAAVIVGIVVTVRKSGTKSTAPSSDTPTAEAPQTPGGASLPPFNPPADLGANCQYAPSAEQASRPAELPRTGRVPTEPATVSVSMVTTQGTFGLSLFNNESPCTVNSFVSLAQQKFFDGTKCHRLTASPTSSVLQCGDPGGDGSGGPGYQFANEYPTDQYAPDDPALHEPVAYPRGTLAMANTNGSQFFMVYNGAMLSPEYTVFGVVDQTGL